MFEFREALQFKNVPAPIRCYYLLENTDREEQTPIVITDEPEQVTYQFMLSRTTDTPPPSPLVLESSAKPSHKIALPSNAENIMGGVPDFNVIRATPTTTPNPSPPSSRENSDAEDFIYQIKTSLPPFCTAHMLSDHSIAKEPESIDNYRIIFTPPPPPSSSSSTSSTTGTLILQTSPDEEVQEYFNPPSHHLQNTSPFMASMRNTSMSPLREDLNEDFFPSVTNNDEGIVMRKLSDNSNTSVGSGEGSDPTPTEAHASATKLPTRKISDISDHSGESGIESTTSKVSDASKDGLPSDRDSSKVSLGSVERKLSNSSCGSTEDELAYIRCSRAGSVTRAVEQYDTLVTRQRKSGLPTVVHPMAEPNGEPEGVGEAGPASNWNRQEEYSPPSSHSM